MKQQQKKNNNIYVIGVKVYRVYFRNNKNTSRINKMILEFLLYCNRIS
jgi:hypothetical protein